MRCMKRCSAGFWPCRTRAGAGRAHRRGCFNHGGQAGSQLLGLTGARRIADHRDARHPWCNFLEELQPFAAQAILELRKASRIAAWPRKIIDIAGPHRINDLNEYDRDRARDLLKWPHRYAAGVQDHIRC